MDNIYNALNIGGEVWFAENSKGTWLHSFFRRMFGAGRNNWSYFSMDNFNLINNKFDNVEFKTNGFLSFFSRDNLIKKILLKIDNKLYNFIPNNWKYVVFGVLKKK